MGAVGFILLFFLTWRFSADKFYQTSLFRSSKAGSSVASTSSRLSSIEGLPEKPKTGLTPDAPVSASAPPSDPTPSQAETVSTHSVPSSEMPAGADRAPRESDEQMTWNLKGHAVPTRRHAFEDLFQSWGLDFPDSEPSACHFAAESGLECIFRRGNLNDLFDVNRPAVLEMSSDDGIRFSVAIVRLDRQNTTLMVNRQARQASTDQVARHWSGRYITVWKPPPGYDGPIKQGMEGPVVDWLTERLGEVAGRKGTPQSLSSAELVREIKKFQIEVGLKPDGIVGQQTLMQLNMRTEQGGPRLHDPIP